MSTAKKEPGLKVTLPPTPVCRMPVAGVVGAPVVRAVLSPGETVPPLLTVSGRLSVPLPPRVPVTPAVPVLTVTVLLVVNEAVRRPIPPLRARLLPALRAPLQVWG